MQAAPTRLAEIPERTLRSYRLGQRVPPPEKREAFARAPAVVALPDTYTNKPVAPRPPAPPPR